MSNTPFQIKPRIIPPTSYVEQLVTSEDRSKAEQHVNSVGIKAVSVVIGCIAVVASGLVTWAIEAAMYRLKLVSDTDATWICAILVMCAALVIGPSIALVIFRRIALRDHLQEVATQRLGMTQQQNQLRENDATRETANKLDALYRNQPANLSMLQKLLAHAETSLIQSNQLLKERAFTPIWDSIEEVVDSLKQFNQRVGLINTSAKQYYELLEGREHSFPPFPVKSDRIPNPDTLVRRLSQVIAVAHRDYQFASIYEQRKTTSAVVAGFRSMQEAITRLGEDIVSSISSLHDSLDSGLRAIHSQLESMEESQQKSVAELRETLESHGKADQTRDKRNEKHQEFVQEAMDNIHHRRKPPV